MELSNLSLVELKNLLNLIPAEIKKREKEDKAKTLKELEALAAERGFNLSDLLGDGSTKVKKEKGTVAVKYRHPTNPELVSSGRGRTAKWIEEYLANGGTLEELAV